MDNVRTNIPLPTKALAVICIFCVLLTFGMLSHFKNSEKAFKNKNAALIREKAELKIQFDSLSAALDNNKITVESLEKERESIASEFARIEKEYKKLKESNARVLQLLKHENKSMRKKIEAFIKGSTDELIKQIALRESDNSVKNILADTLAKIEAAKSGKYVPLDPIIVAAEAPISNNPIVPNNSKGGRVISVDRKNCLIVINMGRSEGVRDGKRCRVISDRGEVAGGTIISTRYTISAAFLDTFAPKRTIEDVSKDEEVVID